MLRQFVRTFVRRAGPLRFAEGEGAGGAVTVRSLDEFKAEWKKAAPNLEFPRLPSDFMAKRPDTSKGVPDKLTLNFILPNDSFYKGQEVDQVIVPATTGQMGVLPGHVPTVAQLKPGLLSVLTGEDTKRYFVSSGFAFIHANSTTDVVAVEAVPLEQLDPEEVRKGLNDYTQKLAAAQSEEDKAEAQIGVEVHSAMSTALAL